MQLCSQAWPRQVSQSSKSNIDSIVASRFIIKPLFMNIRRHFDVDQLILKLSYPVTVTIV